MIDTTSIIFSLAMVVYVIWRASILDRRMPWFGGPSRDREKGRR